LRVSRQKTLSRWRNRVMHINLTLSFQKNKFFSPENQQIKEQRKKLQKNIDLKCFFVPRLFLF
jgi:hypothetical protein